MFISQQDRTETITGKGHLAVHSTPPFEPTTSLLHFQVKVQKKTQKKDF
jgi:hypothetical protein